MRSSEGLWRIDEPSYQRSWEDIEAILDSAINEMNAQRAKYRALMKYQRAKGIVDSLRWVIGVRGQKSPLEEGLGD